MVTIFLQLGAPGPENGSTPRSIFGLLRAEPAEPAEQAEPAEGAGEAGGAGGAAVGTFESTSLSTYTGMRLLRR